MFRHTFLAFHRVTASAGHATPMRRGTCRLAAIALVMAIFPTICLAQSGDGAAPGVNPKDNITKSEFIFVHNRFEGGITATTLAAKLDYAFNANWGANFEVPVTSFKSTFGDAGGIGDVAFRLRNVQSFGPFSVITAAELIAPTAASEFLGSGKWQLSPVIGGVYAFDQLTFAFLGYKHYFSVAGDNDRADIDRSEVRALFARLSTKGTWALADVKYSVSHVDARAETIDLEFEYGSMISKSMALSGRIGTSFLDSDRDFGFTLNLRNIF